MFTGMHRNFKLDDPLAAVLKHNEFTMMGEEILRLKGGEYELRSYFGISHVDGTAAAIERVQRSSVHYLNARIKPITRSNRRGYHYPVGKATPRLSA